MNPHASIQIRWGVLILAASALLAIGAAAAYVVLDRNDPVKPAAAAPPRTEPQPTIDSRAPIDGSPLPDVAVTLSEEAVKRAGIEVAPVTRASGSGRIRVPATVHPNAYRSVVVTPIASGRITRVLVELGQQVRRGQTLAQSYSPELAEAQTRYVAARAELDAHQRELHRTERLVEIGAASRQELERIHAEHTAASTNVQSLRSRLVLLGMTDDQLGRLASAAEINATTSIPAPIDGVVTAREANAGLNVDPSAALFTVVDLSTVWLVGDVYERDLSRVRVGSPASVKTPAYPELMFEGKVSYIDPELKAETRTVQIRVEVANPGRQLRLGMYAEMQVGEGQQTESVLVPRSAVQLMGDRAVVYLSDRAKRGHFVEREVRLGEARDDVVEVLAGVQAGDAVVTKGSFSIRAERERLGLRPRGTIVVQ